jgi:putative ABC transport system permease protein
MESLWQDVRYAVRTLVAQPAFALTAVLTLALGVGANATIFSVCEAVLWKPLPYPEHERLVMLWERVTRDGALSGVAPANFVDWRARSASFEYLGAVDPFPEFTLVGQGDPERVAGARVSSALFPLLGARMAAGRGFLPGEDQPDRNLVAILSHELWQRRFGGDHAVIGRPLTLNDTPFTIVGVLPRGFQIASRVSDFQGRNHFDVWTPLALNPQRLQRGTHPLRVFGRLRSGIGIEQTQAELDVIAKTLEREYPATNRERAISVVPLSEQVAKGVRTPLLTLLVAVGFVWLIACVNIANLLLTRAAVRQQEMAVRLALGASFFRLGRQLVTESMLLASTGALAGTGVAWWSLKLLVHQLPFDLPRMGEIALNAHVLGFIIAISVIAGLVLGCVPLLRGFEASESLKAGRHTVTRGQMDARDALIVGQIALACILLAGASLTGRSLWRLLHVAPGFEAGHVLTADISLNPRRYPDVRRISTFQQEFLAHVRALPGVLAAGIGGYLPLGGTDNSWAPTIEGRAPVAPGEYIQYRPVTSGYIGTLVISLREGRGFTDRDTEEGPAVAIVNEAAARRYWPNENPIGRRLQIDGPPWRTVIGIVADVRHTGLDVEAKPELYLPFAQTPYPNTAMTIVVRTADEPLTLTAAMRAALAEIDSAQALARVRTLDQVVSSSVGEPRFRVVLLGTFALLALTLASIGVYGVMSYLVAQRTREFGIRAALGATRSDLVRLVLKRSAALTATGLAFGLPGAIGLARLVRGLLYGVAPYDVTTLLSVSLLLTASALFASYWPARRAALVEPMQALRLE